MTNAEAVSTCRDSGCRAVTWARSGLAAALLVVARSSVALSEPQAGRSQSVLPSPPAGGQMGFVVSGFSLTYEGNEDDCPGGLTPMLRESFAASLSPTERARLSRDENKAEFQRRYVAFAMGPDDTNFCTNYDRFERPPQKMVRGRVAKGLDLDAVAEGTASPTGCAHQNFTSPSGERGIDNQLWRAMGCHIRFRGTPGMPPVNFELSFGSLASGENSQVLMLRGVDSLVQDEDVEIVYANTQDAAILDLTGKFVSGASYRIGQTPGGATVLRGSIRNGVVEATAPRVQLRRIWKSVAGMRDLRGQRSVWTLNRARLRLSFQPDGSLKGLLAGYQPIRDVLTPISLSGLGALDTGWDCPAMYAALKVAADGDRDPKTGQCTTISTALQVHAVPAFVHAGTDRLQQARTGLPK